MRAHYERGLVLFRQKRFAMAVEEFEHDLAESPGRADARAMLALARLNAGDKRGAWATVEALLSDAPDYAYGFYAATHVAMAYQPPPSPETRGYRVTHRPSHPAEAARRLRRARELIGESLRLSPTTAEYLSTRATIDARLGQWGSCLEAAERGLASNPRHVGCAGLRAKALEVLGQREQAERTIDGAIAENPEAVPAHVVRGWHRLAAGDAAGAESHFREALRQTPTDRQARTGLAQARAARFPPYRWVLRLLFWCSNGLLRNVLVLGGGLAVWVTAWVLADDGGAGRAAAMGLGTLAAVTALFRPILIVRLLFDPVGRKRVPLGQRVLGVSVIAAAIGVFIAVVAYRTRSAVPEMPKPEPWMIH